MQNSQKTAVSNNNPIPGNKPFPKGKSGNPAGRPKGSKNRSTIIKKWLHALSSGKNPLTGETEDLSVEDKMTLALISKAMKGDTHAYKALMDSAYGHPKQEIETTGQSEVITRIRFKDD